MGGESSLNWKERAGEHRTPLNNARTTILFCEDKSLLATSLEIGIYPRSQHCCYFLFEWPIFRKVCKIRKYIHCNKNKDTNILDTRFYGLRHGLDSEPFADCYTVNARAHIKPVLH